MIRKLLLVAGLAMVLAFGLIAARGTTRAAPPGPPIQDFNVDTVNCLVPPGPDTVSPNPLGALPMSCLAGEAKGVDGVTGSLSTAINLPSGDRLGYPYVYNGPGPMLQSDAQIANGTVVGDVVSSIDLNQDGSVDITADSTNCGGQPNSCVLPGWTLGPLTFANAIPEQYVKQTLAWGPGTGCVGDDESYLTALMPGASAMTPYVRYRACIDTVYVQGMYRVDINAANGAPTPLNLVTLSPNWSPAGAHVNLVALSQIADHLSPSSAIIGIDSPQSSLSHTKAPYASNSPTPQLSALWMTEISAPDQADGSDQLRLRHELQGHRRRRHGR